MDKKKKVKDIEGELEKLDQKQILDDIRQYFASVTPEQFLKDVQQACPELFWDESEFPPTAFSRAIKKRKETNPNDRKDLKN